MADLRGNRFGLCNNPEEILAVLEDTAGMYGLRSSQARRYYFGDRSTLRQLNWGSLLSVKKYLGALRRDLHLTTYPSQCGADHLRVKNHYLGFYPRQGMVIKIFLDQDAFLGHVRGVHRFSQLNNHYLLAPMIHNSILAPYPHTRESYVSGKSFQLLPLDLKMEPIAEMADFHFCKPSIMEEILEEEDRAHIIAILGRIGLDSSQLGSIHSFLEPSSWKVIQGEIHGDINQGNLIQGKNAVYLTDWEFFSRGPVAQDLVKIYSQAGPGVRQMILDVYQDKLDSMPQGQDTSDFISALLLYSLKSMLSLYLESREQLSLVFKDQAVVNQKISSYEQTLKKSIQSLLKAAEYR